MNRATHLSKKLKELYGKFPLDLAEEQARDEIQREFTSLMIDSYLECIKDTSQAIKVALGHIKKQFETKGHKND